MKLKIFYSYKLLSAWVISSIYFSAFNVIRADDSENFECGIQTLEDSSNSSDSLFVHPYEYPWKAAIFEAIENKTDTFFGSGHLVNKNTILTMAHIVKDKYKVDDITKNLEQLKIVLGLRNLNDTKETGRREFKAKHIVVHPQWNISSYNFDGDIAIITLTEDVTFSKYIRPICLPDESIASITTGQMSSWAWYDETKQLSEIPRRNEIRVVEYRRCLRRDPFLARLAWEKSFCAAAERYSICLGSSGNGLYVQKNGKFYLRGMVSSTTLDIDHSCGKFNTSLFTDVLLYRDFLEVNDVHSSTSSFECGIQSLNESSSDLSFVRQYEYPWKASLFKVIQNEAYEFFAAGSLVSKNIVLTIAHLTKQKDDGDDFTKNLGKLKIVLGLRNLNDTKETGRREFTVKKIVVHPQWNISSYNFDGDIAIITLTEDVTFSKYIRPICLPDESIASITTGQMSSWAPYDTTNKLSVIPRRNEIQKVEHRECLRKEPGLAFIAWDESFCAAAEGYSFCNGTSGNGLYVQKDGKFFLRGMVSIRLAWYECGTPNIAIFTDVLLYRDFLEENDVFDYTPDLLHSNEDCGVLSAVVGLVSHGDEFQHGLLPWLAALLKYKNNKPKLICGGTLVSAKTVVTAAHCVHNKQVRTGLKKYELRVVLGAHDLSDPHELGKKTLGIEKIVIHSTWNPAEEKKFTGDIAVLVLERNVAFGDYIRPVCLSESLPSVHSGVVAGWGRRENQTFGTSNNTPRKVKIPIVSKTTCYEKEPLLANAGWDKSYCAGRENVSVCDGDSGSGFYVKVNGKYYLKGIVSSAILHEECVLGFYAIFTDAVKYIPFITGPEGVSSATPTISTTTSDDMIYFPID